MLRAPIVFIVVAVCVRHSLIRITDEKHEFDSNEVRLTGYDNTLAELNRRMDECTRAISDKLHYFETCD